MGGTRGAGWAAERACQRALQRAGCARHRGPPPAGCPPTHLAQEALRCGREVVQASLQLVEGCGSRRERASRVSSGEAGSGCRAEQARATAVGGRLCATPRLRAGRRQAGRRRRGARPPPTHAPSCSVCSCGKAPMAVHPGGTPPYRSLCCEGRGRAGRGPGWEAGRARVQAGRLAHALRRAGRRRQHVGELGSTAGAPCRPRLPHHPRRCGAHNVGASQHPPHLQVQLCERLQLGQLSRQAALQAAERQAPAAGGQARGARRARVRRPAL